MIRVMIALKAHFDGKVFVPDEPLDLAPNRAIRIIVLDEPSEPTTGPRTDFSQWIGAALPLPENHTPRFQNNDDLWDKQK